MCDRIDIELTEKTIMTENKEWSVNDTLSLISHWELCPELWDTKCPDYQIESKKRDALKKLALLFTTDEYEIQRKLYNLRTQYVNELQAVANRTNDIVSEDGAPRFSFFPAMNFIRTSTTNLNDLSNLVLDDGSFTDDRNLCSLEICDVRSEVIEEFVLPNPQLDSQESLIQESQVESSKPSEEKCDNSIGDSGNQISELPEIMHEMLEKQKENQETSEETFHTMVPLVETQSDQPQQYAEESQDRWSDSKTLKLICLLKNEENWWKKSHKDYNDKNKREASIRKIATALGIGVTSVKHKIKNLRCQYRNEYRRGVERSIGEFKEDKIKSNWKFYNTLQFLYVGNERNNNEDSLGQVSENRDLDSGSSSSEDLEIPSPSRTISIPSRQRTNKRKVSESDKQKDKWLNFNDRVVDEHQIFADFLANEMRTYPKWFAVKLKQEVLKSVLEVNEEYMQECENISKDVL